MARDPQPPWGLLHALAVRSLPPPFCLASLASSDFLLVTQNQMITKKKKQHFNQWGEPLTAESVAGALEGWEKGHLGERE